MPDSRPTSGQQILEMMGGFRPACVIGAGAELDIWGRLGDKSLSAEALARLMDCDLRAITMLLDALAALGLLAKNEGCYSVPGEIRPLMAEGSPQTVLPMIRHQMNVMRGWSQLAWVAKSGVRRRDRPASADSRPIGRHLSRPCTPFRKCSPTIWSPNWGLCSSGTCWTWAGPRAHGRWLSCGPCQVQRRRFSICPTPSDRPRSGLKKSEFASRVTLVSGDFYSDDLPAGGDFAWVSAIAHQHSRKHNRDLFAKVFKALEPTRADCHSRYCNGPLPH